MKTSLLTATAVLLLGMAAQVLVAIDIGTPRDQMGAAWRREHETTIKMEAAAVRRPPEPPRVIVGLR